MGQRKYPPLSTSDVIEILIARGFTKHHTKGDHVFYGHSVKGKKHIAQVDLGCSTYTEDLLKKVLKETGLSREQFYCSTRSAAKKLNLTCASNEELRTWAIA